MIDFLDNNLGNLLKRAKKISEDKIWEQSFNAKLKKQILDWIRDDQLKHGLNDENDVIGLYSIWTEAINPLKKAGTPYTLNDTGDFYKSLFVEVLSDYFIIDGDGLKIGEDTEENVDLFEEYGDGIVGLNDENKEKLSEELKIKYIENVRKILQIN